MPSAKNANNPSRERVREREGENGSAVSLTSLPLHSVLISFLLTALFIYLFVFHCCHGSRAIVSGSLLFPPFSVVAGSSIPLPLKSSGSASAALPPRIGCPGTGTACQLVPQSPFCTIQPLSKRMHPYNPSTAQLPAGVPNREAARVL